MAYLSPHPEPVGADGRGIVTGALDDLGWMEGRNLRIERALGAGVEQRLPQLAADLARKRVDLIFAVGPEAAVAAARSTATIPIVFWAVGLPVEQGLVESLARPGRNATGIAWMSASEVATKQLEVLRQLAPTAKRMAWLEVPGALQTVRGETVAQPRLNIREAGRELGVELVEEEIVRAEDIEPVFARFLAANAQALGVRPTMLTWRERTRIAALAIAQRLPSAYGGFDWIEAGGLVSYGIDWRPTIPPAAAYIDRILRGERPSELPVVLPSRYELGINLKTARALGLIVPPSLLLRADKVIE